MTTQTKQKNTTFSKENQAFALWKQKGKNGKTFLSSKTMIGFYNTNKKNPKEPDMRIYHKDANGKTFEREAPCSLWCNVSKDGNKKYLSGKYQDKNVVGFISNKDNPKIPYISVYFKEEKAETKEDLTIKLVPQVEQPTLDLQDEDLPF